MGGSWLEKSKMWALRKAPERMVGESGTGEDELRAAELGAERLLNGHFPIIKKKSCGATELR